jgi:hypothetical protein
MCGYLLQACCCCHQLLCLLLDGVLLIVDPHVVRLHATFPAHQQQRQLCGCTTQQPCGPTQPAPTQGLLLDCSCMLLRS